ncbi:MAG TPA: hypothetical protein VIF62_29415, partial [Labilithrix sp.]
TCDNCAMCDKGQEAHVPMEYFKPDLKCCTYDPLLPNYLVGAIFKDPDPSLDEGRKRLRERIATRMGVTPHRVSPPRKKTLHAISAQGANFFGRSYAIVCPYLEREKGLCTIWRHREAVCSTYYCKYTHGAVGYEHWRALKEFLGYVEYLLSQWAAKEVDPDTIEPQIKRGELTLEDLEDRPPEDETYAKWWGDKWVGREEEFYVKTYELVSQLSKIEFNRIVFARKESTQWLEAAIKKYDEASSPILPERLVRNKKIRERDAGEKLVISTYNRFDSFVIERDLFDVLGMLDPELSVEENLKKLDEEYGIELHPDLLRELYRQSVLVPPVVEADPKSAMDGPPKPGS